MKKKITINEDKFNKIFNNELNEISYGTAEKAYVRNEDIFWEVQSKFEDFLCALEDAQFKVKHESEEGEQTSNPYLEKIQGYADVIYDILLKKSKQANYFGDEINKFDHNKFYDDMGDREDYTDYDELELRDLQSKYPK